MTIRTCSERSHTIILYKRRYARTSSTCRGFGDSVLERFSHLRGPKQKNRRKKKNRSVSIVLDSVKSVGRDCTIKTTRGAQIFVTCVQIFNGARKTALFRGAVFTYFSIDFHLIVRLLYILIRSIAYSNRADCEYIMTAWCIVIVNLGSRKFIVTDE